MFHADPTLSKMENCLRHAQKTRYRPGVYRDLRINNFRRFQKFSMEGLGRVNLLVGPNNCGKTTILEAIDLLASPLDPCLLGAVSIYRGAVSAPAGESSVKSARIALRHLFYGHRVSVGSFFKVGGSFEKAEHSLSALIANEPEQPQLRLKVSADVWLRISRQERSASENEPTMKTAVIPLTSSIEWPVVDWEGRARVADSSTVSFLGTDSLERWMIVESLAAIQLNPEEELVLDILRLIEPTVEGITAVHTPEVVGLRDRVGVFVKLRGQRERVPIASLGEGMWRLLALALELVSAKGSVLLVDEIDIGLHYTAQAEMWQMVKKAAESLDVQVFATTHSRDCIYALAQIARADVTDGSDVTIQRIEGERAVAYNEQEIVLAAQRGIEVR